MLPLSSMGVPIPLYAYISVWGTAPGGHVKIKWEFETKAGMERSTMMTVGVRCSPSFHCVSFRLLFQIPANFFHTPLYVFCPTLYGHLTLHEVHWLHQQWKH